MRELSVENIEPDYKPEERQRIAREIEQKLYKIFSQYIAAQQ